LDPNLKKQKGLEKIDPVNQSLQVPDPWRVGDDFEFVAKPLFIGQSAILQAAPYKLSIPISIQGSIPISIQVVDTHLDTRVDTYFDTSCRYLSRYKGRCRRWASVDTRAEQVL